MLEYGQVTAHHLPTGYRPPSCKEILDHMTPMLQEHVDAMVARNEQYDERDEGAYSKILDDYPPYSSSICIKYGPTKNEFFTLKAYSPQYTINGIKVEIDHAFFAYGKTIVIHQPDIPICPDIRFYYVYVDKDLALTLKNNFACPVDPRTKPKLCTLPLNKSY